MNTQVRHPPPQLIVFLRPSFAIVPGASGLSVAVTVESATRQSRPT